MQSAWSESGLDIVAKLEHIQASRCLSLAAEPLLVAHAAIGYSRLCNLTDRTREDKKGYEIKEGQVMERRSDISILIFDLRRKSSCYRL